MAENTALKRTPLYELHRELGAKLVPFAGYEMPVQYPTGIISEHKHTRAAASLFDVSHMGQALLLEAGGDPIAAFERLVPADLQELEPGRTRYTQLLNQNGGILDDLMATRLSQDGAGLYLVVNAARKDPDFEVIEADTGGDARLEILEDQALLALQGPEAVEVMATLVPEARDMAFMSVRPMVVEGMRVWVSRSGYTGEDGFEISVEDGDAEKLARVLLAHDAVAPAGLGARDSLRLEAGLCLYGHDIDETTTPVEARLSWSIGKRRRREGGFPGADVIQEQLANGPAIKRVGLKPEGRAPVREGVELCDSDGETVGRVTSGGFGPTVGGPVAMGYLPSELAEPGTAVTARVRGKDQPMTVAKLPFVEKGSQRVKRS